MYNKHLPYGDINKILRIKNSEHKHDESKEEIGYLDINVFRYVLRTPLEDAFVRVSKLSITGMYHEKGMGIYMNTNKSDANGIVPTFTLPVFNDDENSIYIVSIQAQGYHSAYVIDVPIYPNVTTTYDIFLRHYTFAGTPDFEFIMQPKMPGRERRSIMN